MSRLNGRVRQLEKAQAPADGGLYVYYQQLDRPGLYRSQATDELLARDAVGSDVGASDEDTVILVEHDEPAE